MAVGQSDRFNTARRLSSEERGVALLLALMAILLMMGLGTALVLSAGIESRIARNFRNGTGALYAADAALERAVGDLRTIRDWNAVLSGAVSSPFADGLPGGARTLDDGRSIDIAGIVNLANCRQAATCSEAAMDAFTSERPWGPNNPRWQPFAWGRLQDLLPDAAAEAPFYVVVMAADDQSENDGDPLRDGATMCTHEQVTGCNPGTGLLALRAEAFGPFGAHKILELTVSRAGASGDEPVYNSGTEQAGVRILSWREVR